MKPLVSIIIAFLSFACTHTKEERLPFFSTPDFTPQWISPSNPGYKNIHTIPAFSFINQNGKTITQKDVDGKIYVADFFFTRCTGICPKMITSMRKVAAAFANDNDVAILSHSVTPEYDSVAALKRYAEAKHINKYNWHLLTGDKESIYKIARKGYFADESLGFDKDTSEFLHTENFVLIDRHRRIRGIYNGTIELEIEQLIKHIRMLRAEDAD